MNLFCEEVHKLEAEFKQCRKLLNAIDVYKRQSEWDVFERLAMNENETDSY